MRSFTYATLVPLSAMASAALTQPSPTLQSFSNDEGWAVSINRDTRQCELSTVFPSDDGELYIRLVPDGPTGPVSFVLAGDSFHGTPGTLTFVFDGKPTYAGAIDTVLPQAIGAKLPSSALDSFGIAGRLELRIDGRPVARLILEGSSPAIAHLRACAATLALRR